MGLWGRRWYLIHSTFLYASSLHIVSLMMYVEHKITNRSSFLDSMLGDVHSAGNCYGNLELDPAKSFTISSVRSAVTLNVQASNCIWGILTSSLMRI